MITATARRAAHDVSVLAVFALTAVFAPAIMLHEATHYAAARVLGFNVVDVSLLPPEFEYRDPGDRPRAAAVVAVAPTLIGSTIGGTALILLSAVTVTASPGTTYAVMSLIVYLLPSPADFRAAENCNT